jgi:hypothetical protein
MQFLCVDDCIALSGEILRQASTAPILSFSLFLPSRCVSKFFPRYHGASLPLDESVVLLKRTEPPTAMELYGTGFNAFNQMQFIEPLPEDPHDLYEFKCILAAERIEILRTSYSSILG